ncbi:MAG: DUF4932 domain-containing protein [Bacteroidales bacterium]
MNEKAILMFVLVFSRIAFAQQNAMVPMVDERTELLSAVFRFAGADEYINNRLKSYTNELDSSFKAFKNSEVVQIAKQLRKKDGVSFDAVMSLAIHLEITDKISLKNNIKEESIDKRWNRKDIENFIVQLNRFYYQSKFHDFFIAHEELYNQAQKNFEEILRDVDFYWFPDFFGKSQNSNFNLVLSMLNGGSNYGPKIRYNDGSEDLYAIIGTWHLDSLGQPAYSKSTIQLIIHEFNHSFCNPLIDKNFKTMEQNAIGFYKAESEILKEQAYGNARTMSYEILVRACVIKYYQQKNTPELKVRKLILDEKSRGFLWIEELVELLNDYIQNRHKYKALDDFMPEIVKLQNSLNPDEIKKNWQDSCVRVVSCNIENNSENVNPDNKAIILRFSRPMYEGMYGTSIGKRGEKYFPEFPENEKAGWTDSTRMEWKFPVILKPDREYSISFPAQFFRSENIYPMVETFYLDFRTAK